METYKIFIVSIILSAIVLFAKTIVFKRKMKGRPKQRITLFYLIYFLAALIILVVLLLFIKNLLSGLIAETS